MYQIMIVSVGIDIVEHSVTKKLGWDTNTLKVRRFFSKEELIAQDMRNQIQYLSGRFAAKEATLKCLCTGMQDGISLKDVVVLSSPLGNPYIKLTGRAQIVAIERGINMWHISISHSSQFSMAMVIAEAQ